MSSDAGNGCLTFVHLESRLEEVVIFRVSLEPYLFEKRPFLQI